MAQNAQEAKAGLDVAGSGVQPKGVEPGSAVIKYTNLTYVQDEATSKNKVLGKGGCGVVYLGTYRQVEGQVAIKELFIQSASEEIVSEFQNEVQIMGKLRSDYLVQFYGCCLSPKYCLVMEYMPEGSLFQLLHNKQPLDWNLRYQISIHMSLGLEFLHENNILHRDIKSLNVLLKKGQAKLSDFGLSRIKKESNSTQGGSVGTVQWMAPELFERRPHYTQKSDIYSLGMTFWEIASRQIPFLDAENNGIISAWVGQGERETIPADCPKKYSSLIFSCWKGEGAKADERWKGKPTERPSARQITDYLRSKDEDFEAFISGKPASQPQYLGNLASSVVDLKDAQDVQPQSPAKPPAKIPAVPVQPLVPQYQAKVVVQQGQAIKPEPSPVKPVVVDAEELEAFLHHIGFGEQDEAEAMLKKNKALALAAGVLTDNAKRTFQNITALQYAVWALDWKMWTMLMLYLPQDAAKAQAKGFKEGAWVKEHAEHASWKNVTDAQQVYVDKYSSWDYRQRVTHLDNSLAPAQFQLPIHVLQEYNNLGKPFEPCPNFAAEYTLKRELPRWLNVYIHQKGRFDYSIYRFKVEECCIERAGWRESLDSWIDRADRIALISLYDTRLQQRSKLVAALLCNTVVDLKDAQDVQPQSPAKSPDKLSARPVQPLVPQYQAQVVAQQAQAIKPEPPKVTEPSIPIDAKELQTFLDHVAWGRQPEAEAMLKKNKKLALGAGDVTDNARKSFKNITALQYAVWALDWKMWTMLMAYLPNDAAIAQARGFKEGAWVKEYAEHTNWKNVTDAQQVYVDKYSSWGYNQCMAHLNNNLAPTQFQLPIHVLQEYNNPGRPFEPCPNFSADYKLERKLPDWLNTFISKGKFDYSIFRYNYAEARLLLDGSRDAWLRGDGWLGPADRTALISLYDTRVSQRAELVASLLGISNKPSNAHTSTVPKLN